MELTTNQKWAVIVATFILLFCTIIGGYVYGVLVAPPSTSKLTLEADMDLDTSGETTIVDSINFGKFEVEISSKLFDVIMLGLSDIIE